MAAIETATGLEPRAHVRGQGAVRAWLYIVALMIVAMVVVGGATRLTESGLSITEWQPIHGVIPPIGEAEWQEEFAKYRQIPEYQVLNRGMTLAEFKGIYWWEWAHRLLGRVIGVVFLVPLIWFAATGRIGRALVPKLAAIFVLGGLQGAVGWWMVASGLTERTDVSQYRLAVHLTLACVLLAAILALARDLAGSGGPAPTSLRRGAFALVVLVFVQIFLGALVAGLNAGLISDTWPLMHGALVPEGLLAQSPAWLNFLENALTVHFDHRVVAYALFAYAVFHAFRARSTPHAAGALAMVLLLAGQATLGIATVTSGVPIHLALLHQLGAVVVLSAAVFHWRGMAKGGEGAWTAARPQPS